MSTTPTVAPYLAGIAAKLQDPVVVHAAMLRGEIAKPAIRDMLHAYGADALARWDAAQQAPDAGPNVRGAAFGDALRWAIRACGAQQRDDGLWFGEGATARLARVLSEGAAPIAQQAAPAADPDNCALKKAFNEGRQFEAERLAAIGAAPAQARQPLTVDHAAAIFKAWREGPLWLHMTRGTEAAHGIPATPTAQPTTDGEAP